MELGAGYSHPFTEYAVWSAKMEIPLLTVLPWKDHPFLQGAGSWDTAVRTLRLIIKDSICSVPPVYNCQVLTFSSVSSGSLVDLTDLEKGTYSHHSYVSSAPLQR